MNNRITNKSFTIMAIMAFAISFSAKAQTTLYSNTFDNSGTGPGLPSDWTTNTSDSTWVLTNARVSSDTLSKSSKNYSLDIECASAHANQNAIATLSGFSTVGYKNITISWSERYAPKYISAGNTLTIQYSIDGGTTWNTITDAANLNGDFEWANNGVPTVLPATAENLANVKLRWDAFIHSTNGNYQFDDLSVTGTATSGINETLFGKNANTWYANNQLHLQFENVSSSQKADIMIYSSDGKLVYHNNCNATNNSMDVSSLIPGCYIAKILSNNNLYTYRFVK